MLCSARASHSHTKLRAQRAARFDPTNTGWGLTLNLEPPTQASQTLSEVAAARNGSTGLARVFACTAALNGPTSAQRNRGLSAFAVGTQMLSLTGPWNGFGHSPARMLAHTPESN